MKIPIFHIKWWHPKNKSEIHDKVDIVWKSENGVVKYVISADCSQEYYEFLLRARGISFKDSKENKPSLLRKRGTR